MPATMHNVDASAMEQLRNGMSWYVCHAQTYGLDWAIHAASPACKSPLSLISSVSAASNFCMACVNL